MYIIHFYLLLINVLYLSIRFNVNLLLFVAPKYKRLTTEVWQLVSYRERSHKKKKKGEIKRFKYF